MPTTATEIMNRLNEISFNSSLMRGLGVSSKLNARMDFLLHLKEIGRSVAERWLDTHYDAIGERSTIDISEKFL